MNMSIDTGKPLIVRCLVRADRTTKSKLTNFPGLFSSYLLPKVHCSMFCKYCPTKTFQQEEEEKVDCCSRTATMTHEQGPPTLLLFQILTML